MPGTEVEMKLMFYSWLSDQINAKSSLSMITKPRSGTSFSDYQMGGNGLLVL